MNDKTETLSAQLQKDLQLNLAEGKSFDELRAELINHINDLINNDFEKLVFLLYRIDVNEERMKKFLTNNNGENSATLIADLIIERQLQKIETRKKFDTGSDISDDEKW